MGWATRPGSCRPRRTTGLAWTGPRAGIRRPRPRAASPRKRVPGARQEGRAPACPRFAHVMTALIRIIDLHKSFGALEVLKGVDLEIARGECVSIIGPSGSGKTTLLRCVNFLERPTKGEIWVDSQRIGQRSEGGRLRDLSDREMARERAEIGFVFQRFNLFPH